MVLDDATSNPQDGWTDDASPSADLNSYSANPTTPFLNTYHIDVEKLPQPSLLSRKLARQRMADGLERSLARYSNEVGRPLTQAEAEAICYINSKSVQTVSRSGPFFAILAAARCYQTAGTFRFPLYQPNPTTFNPNTLFGIVTGTAARITWHSLRLGTYCGAATLSGMMFIVAPYVSSTGVARMVSDPRLQHFNQDMSRARNEKREEIVRRAGLQRPESSQPGQARFPSTGGRGMKRTQDDDMSPTSSDYTFSDDSPTAESGATSGSQSHSFDSSSSNSAASNSDAGGGSAWDRIRAHATGSSNPASTQCESAWSRTRGSGSEVKRESKTDSTVGDSFSFSDAEEERQLAKSEAQKEFDARIERERNGKDF